MLSNVSIDYEEEAGANSWLESSNNVYLGASGNVGIGDSTPSYKLDVTGDINFTGNLRQNGSVYAGSLWTEVNSEVYYAGNVGVGNTNPGEKLDVTGGVKIGSAVGTANGTIQWTGSELQVRIGGAWKKIAMFDEIPGVFIPYSFTTFTFTNCGVTGRYGPTLTQCKASYSPSWTDNTSNFNITQTGYQIWTVPETASYTIDAYGARGGTNHLGANAGNGARCLGTFSLTEGDKYMILVGQMGLNAQQAYGGSGGGGGTFIVKGTNYSLAETGDVKIAAGGGGGAGADPYNSRVGGAGQASSNNGTNGGAQGAYSSGGGGGFNNNGSGNATYIGHAFTDGGSGGTQSSSYGGTSHGGFGGGGSITHHPGGGGGGYSGGDAGYLPSWTEGGLGGGSINNGTNTSNWTNNNTGQGKVIITKL